MIPYTLKKMEKKRKEKGERRKAEKEEHLFYAWRYCHCSNKNMMYIREKKQKKQAYFKNNIHCFGRDPYFNQTFC